NAERSSSCVAPEFLRQSRKNGAAERQVAQVVLEGGEAGDRLPIHPEGGNAIRDHLLGLGDDSKDGAAERLERAPFRLLDTPEVVVNFLGRHLPPSLRRVVDR